MTRTKLAFVGFVAAGNSMWHQVLDDLCLVVTDQSATTWDSSYAPNSTQYTTPVLLRTTKYYSSTSPLLLHYFSVLQSTSPVLLRTTKYYSSTTSYYKVLVQYYFVLLRTTKYYSSTTPYYKVLLQYFSSTTPVLLCTTKY